MVNKQERLIEISTSFSLVDWISRNISNWNATESCQWRNKLWINDFCMAHFTYNWDRHRHFILCGCLKRWKNCAYWRLRVQYHWNCTLVLLMSIPVTHCHQHKFNNQNTCQRPKYYNETAQIIVSNIYKYICCDMVFCVDEHVERILLLENIPMKFTIELLTTLQDLQLFIALFRRNVDCWNV